MRLAAKLRRGALQPRRVAIPERQARAFRGEATRDAKPYSRRCARDHRHAALEARPITHALSPAQLRTSVEGWMPACAGTSGKGCASLQLRSFPRKREPRLYRSRGNIIYDFAPRQKTLVK